MTMVSGPTPNGSDVDLDEQCQDIDCFIASESNIAPRLVVEADDSQLDIDAMLSATD
ncbi:hypothetical protein HK405_010855 [Cladochytrium tenue]|nr:hypothetical protein HK405_010855 [Cladochytrium tenue]